MQEEELTLEAAVELAEEEWPDEVQSVFAGKIETILERGAATQVLGSYRATIEHYEQIREVNGVSEVYLHEDAAGPFGAAWAEFLTTGDRVPDISVAFAFRDRELGRGNCHTLGYAVDFEPDDNPHISTEIGTHGQEIIDLLELTTGESNEADLGESHRRNIRRAARRTELEPEQEEFLDQVEAEFQRLAEMSDAFRGSLGQERRAELLELRDHYFQATDDDKRQEVMDDVQEVLQPWLELIDDVREEAGRLDDCVQGLTAVIELLPDIDQELSDWEQEAGGLIGLDGRCVYDRLEYVIRHHSSPRVELAATERKEQLRQARAWCTIVDPLFLDAPTDLPSLYDYYPSCLERAEERRESLSGIVERLETLRTQLTENPRFLFGQELGETGTAVQECLNPPVTQLVERGFFNLPPRLFRILARHGFDFGSTWESHADAMHVELGRHW